MAGSETGSAGDAGGSGPDVLVLGLVLVLVLGLVVLVVLVVVVVLALFVLVPEVVVLLGATLCCAGRAAGGSALEAPEHPGAASSPMSATQQPARCLIPCPVLTCPWCLRADANPSPTTKIRNGC